MQVVVIDVPANTHRRYQKEKVHARQEEEKVTEWRGKVEGVQGRGGEGS